MNSISKLVAGNLFEKTTSRRSDSLTKAEAEELILRLDTHVLTKHFPQQIELSITGKAASFIHKTIVSSNFTEINLLHS
jgi:hypothetical protein